MALFHHYLQRCVFVMVGYSTGKGVSRKQLGGVTWQLLWDWLGAHPEARACDLMDRFTLKRSTAYYVLGKFGKSSTVGQFTPGDRPGRTKIPKLTLQFRITNVLREDSTLTLRGIRKCLRLRYKVKVSRETISRASRVMGWTRKRVTHCPVGRNTCATLEARQAYAEKVFLLIHCQLLSCSLCCWWSTVRTLLM